MATTERPNDGSYYADGRRIFRSPVETRRADGSTGISIGFGVCDMLPHMEEQGPALAAMLNRADRCDALEKALSDAADSFQVIWEYWNGSRTDGAMSDALDTIIAVADKAQADARSYLQARAALSKAGAAQ